jgi:anti-sigma regulatory factor (Ser/Thr protein kinase)
MSEAHPLTLETLTVAAKFEALPQIKEYLLKISAVAGLDKKATYKLRLAVDEIATNIITHGYAGAETAGFIRLEACLDSQNLTLCLEDEGPAFDPTQAIPPDLSLGLDERPIGGLGVFLAQQSVDEFRYERAGNCNRNILVVKRPVNKEGAGH